MGTLSDITSQVQNVKRTSNASSMGYVSIVSPAAAEKENHGRTTKSSHFMTPTFAFKQSTTPTSNHSNRPATPRTATPLPAKGTKQDNGNKFFRRVGLGRASETVCLKKVTVSKDNVSFSFPDKECLSCSIVHFSLTSPTACHPNLYKADGSVSSVFSQPTYQGLSSRQAVAYAANCTGDHLQSEEAQDHAH